MLIHIARWLSLFILLFIFGCQSNESTSSYTSSEKDVSQERQSDSEQSNKNNIKDDQPLNKMFFSQIPQKPYPKTIKLHINNQEVEATFQDFKFTPYAIYVPKTLIKLDYEDGVEFGFNEAEKISVFDLELNGTDEPITSQIKDEHLTYHEFKELDDPEFSIYESYITSIINENDVRYDFFFYQVDENKGALIRFRYFERNKSEILPTFLETAKHIIYLEE